MRPKLLSREELFAKYRGFIVLYLWFDRPHHAIVFDTVMYNATSSLNNKEPALYGFCREIELVGYIRQREILSAEKATIEEILTCSHAPVRELACGM